MKKLKLNLEQLNKAEVLTRSQLKKVLGGAGLVTTMHVTTVPPCPSGNCDYTDPITGHVTPGFCGGNRPACYCSNGLNNSACPS